MTPILLDEFQELFESAMPPAAVESVLPDAYFNKNAAQGMDWTEINALLRQVGPAPYPYDLKKWNCADNSRWVINQVKVLWAKQGGELPLCIGIIEGNVPLDGDNRVDGWHSLGWHFDREKKLHLIGCYDRAVMGPYAVGQIKDVEYFGLGG